MGLFASTAFAVVSLVFVSAVALGSMLGSAGILHLVSPDRRFDAFRALHEPLVVGLLFGLGVLWLLPPHPWAVEPARGEPKAASLSRRRRLPDGPLRPTGVAAVTGGPVPPCVAAAEGTGSGSWLQEQQRCCGSGRRGTPAPPCRINGERRCSSGSTREPPVLGSLGDVLIHRPSLVAGPVGSEWRNLRPDPAINSTQGAQTNEYEAIHEQEGGGHRPRRGDHPRCGWCGLRLLHDALVQGSGSSDGRELPAPSTSARRASPGTSFRATGVRAFRSPSRQQLGVTSQKVGNIVFGSVTLH